MLHILRANCGSHCRCVVQLPAGNKNSSQNGPMPAPAMFGQTPKSTHLKCRKFQRSCSSSSPAASTPRSCCNRWISASCESVIHIVVVSGAEPAPLPVVQPQHVSFLCTAGPQASFTMAHCSRVECLEFREICRDVEVSWESVAHLLLHLLPQGGHLLLLVLDKHLICAVAPTAVGRASHNSIELPYESK